MLFKNYIQCSGLKETHQPQKLLLNTFNGETLTFQLINEQKRFRKSLENLRLYWD